MVPEKLVGKRVEVMYEVGGIHKWFAGTIKRMSKPTTRYNKITLGCGWAFIKFDEGEKDWLKVDRPDAYNGTASGCWRLERVAASSAKTNRELEYECDEPPVFLSLGLSDAKLRERKRLFQEEIVTWSDPTPNAMDALGSCNESDQLREQEEDLEVVVWEVIDTPNEDGTWTRENVGMSQMMQAFAVTREDHTAPVGKYGRKQFESLMNDD